MDKPQSGFIFWLGNHDCDDRCRRSKYCYIVFLTTVYPSGVRFVIMENSKQTVFVNIIQTWYISDKPKFRPFTCGHCHTVFQGPAYHHWVNTENYKTPIHLCQSCEQVIHDGTLTATFPKNAKHEKTVEEEYSETVKKAFDDIISAWDTTKDPGFKVFTCDKCKQEVPRANGLQQACHCWYQKGNVLSEVHLCKACYHAIEK